MKLKTKSLLIVLVLFCMSPFVLAQSGITQAEDANQMGIFPQNFEVFTPIVHQFGGDGSGIWFDDFNRPDSTNMGPDWTEMDGDLVITDNHGKGNLSSGWSYMLHNSADENYADAVMEIDLLTPSGSSGPHVSLIMGVTPGSVSWLYTKIQDNDDDGFYDRLFFYSYANGTPWGSDPFQTLTNPIQTGHVTMYVTNSGDTLNVDIDEDFNGTVDQHYENTGILSLLPLGTGFGIGTWAMGAFDNWGVNCSGLPLSADKNTMSSRKEGIINFYLDAGEENAFRSYILLGGTSGVSPGIVLPGGLVTLPLNPDLLTAYILTMMNTPVFMDFMSELDDAGCSMAQFNNEGLMPISHGCVGTRMTFSYALYYPWDFVSNSVEITITE
jgi:hypothetical protein